VLKIIFTKQITLLKRNMKLLIGLVTWFLHRARQSGGQTSSIVVCCVLPRGKKSFVFNIYYLSRQICIIICIKKIIQWHFCHKDASKKQFYAFRQLYQVHLDTLLTRSKQRWLTILLSLCRILCAEAITS